MLYIVGSGPAAVAASHALLRRGVKVTMLDVGHRLEKDKAKIKKRMASMEPDDWDEKDISALREGSKPSTKGIPKKRVYGSEFVYHEPRQASQIEQHDSKIMCSFAMGGLSNVWGSCSLAYPDSEMNAWPQASRDLASHYRSVMHLMPQVAQEDDLSKLLPLYGDHYGEPVLSRQAKALLSDLNRNREKLSSHGIFFGSARLALKNDEGDCRRCGLCLYGCPYDLIYSASNSIAQLKEYGLRYRAGVFVQRIEESDAGCVIHGWDIEADEAIQFSGDRVFVAAGIWSTTEIMLRSMDAYDTEVTMKNSDRFMLPMMRLSGTPGVETESLTTLSQLFIEINDRAVAPQSVHLQIYTYNDMMRIALQNKLGRAAPLFRWPLSVVLSRLLIIFGYLHSDSSGYLTVKLQKGNPDKLVVRGIRNPESKRIIWHTWQRLLREFSSLRALPSMPMIDPVGGGNHTGGSFPMHDMPSGFQTNIWGTPDGWKRVHLVDTSVFPSLPAATVAFPAMANAHRIASHVVI